MYQATTRERQRYRQATLTFTPQNYNVDANRDSERGGGDDEPVRFTCKFLTNSTDSVFNGLSDSWPYTNTTVPSPWTDVDVGTVSQAGSATVTGGTFTMQGAGTNNWGTADAFNFCYQPVSGDAVIIARVLGVQRTATDYSTGVVTFRNSLQAGDVNATMNANSTGSVNQYSSAGVDFTWRAATGGTSTDTGWTSRSYTPEWIKLVRSGNNFSAYYGTTGTNWTQEGTTQTIPMSQTALVGVGASGNDTTDLATAMLDNVSVQQVLATVNVAATGSTAYKQGPTTGQYTITRSGSASMLWPLTVILHDGGGGDCGQRLHGADRQRGHPRRRGIHHSDAHADLRWVAGRCSDRYAHAGIECSLHKRINVQREHFDLRHTVQLLEIGEFLAGAIE